MLNTMKINDNTKLKLSESSYQNYNIDVRLALQKVNLKLSKNVMTLKMVYVLMPMHRLLMVNQTRILLLWAMQVQNSPV